MRTLHLVSHTHWDREWYRTFQQFRLKLVSLVDQLLDILATDPAYAHFMLDGQTIVLDDYLAMRPARRADLEHTIRNGRLLVGPWFVLPDEFLVSPESIIRNLLLGRQIAAQYGACMDVGYIPDPFGHIGQMPQILRGFGIQTACVMRGLDDQPAELAWQAPDGSTVWLAYLRDGYGNASGFNPSRPDLFLSEVKAERDALLPHTAASNLLLMNGTDHMFPSTDTPGAVAATLGRLDGDTLIHSTLPAYLAAAQAELKLERLPVVMGELRSSKRTPLLPGVLSARVWIKQANRAAEALLEAWAEPFSVWANLADQACPVAQPPQTRRAASLDKPQDILRQAWRLLLENHPHDSICGCSIDQVHAEMRPRFDQVTQIADEITRQSLERLAEGVSTATVDPAVISAVMVFNPSGSIRTDVARVTLELPDETGAFDLLDSQGCPIAYQVEGLGREELFNGIMNRGEFQAAMGMVGGGYVGDLALVDLQLRQDGEQVFLEAIVSQHSLPNLEALERGLKQAQAYLANPAIKTYTVRAHSNAEVKVTLAAQDVPAYGYGTYWVRPKPGAKNAPRRLNPLLGKLFPLGLAFAESRAGKWLLPRLRPDPASRPPYVIENSLLRVKARRDGTLDVLDKRSGTLYRGLNRLVDGGDAGDEYNFNPPGDDELVSPALKSIRVLRGAVRQSLEMRLELNTPQALTPDRQERDSHRVGQTVTVTASLTEGLARVDLHTVVDNQARDHRLRAHFPAPFGVDGGDFDGHFEVVHRRVGTPDHDDSWVEQPRPEAPQRAFTTLSDGHNGLTIANRGLAEAEVISLAEDASEIAVTLLRCVGWLSRSDLATRKGPAGPVVETPGAQLPGEWTFDTAIIPHAGGWESAFALAYAFQNELRALSANLHGGNLPPEGSFLAVEPPEFAISAVKITEDGSGWLARGTNLSGAPIRARLTPSFRPKEAARANLAEEIQGGLEISADGGVCFEAKPHEIVTVVFR